MPLNQLCWGALPPEELGKEHSGPYSQTKLGACQMPRAYFTHVASMPRAIGGENPSMNSHASQEPEGRRRDERGSKPKSNRLRRESDEERSEAVSWSPIGFTTSHAALHKSYGYTVAARLNARALASGRRHTVASTSGDARTQAPSVPFRKRHQWSAPPTAHPADARTPHQRLIAQEFSRSFSAVFL